VSNLSALSTNHAQDYIAYGSEVQWNWLLFNRRIMTEDEMQGLRDSICEGIAEYFDNYDWDKAFQKYLEDK